MRDILHFQMRDGAVWDSLNPKGGFLGNKRWRFQRDGEQSWKWDEKWAFWEIWGMGKKIELGVLKKTRGKGGLGEDEKLGRSLGRGVVVDPSPCRTCLALEKSFSQFLFPKNIPPSFCPFPSRRGAQQLINPSQPPFIGYHHLHHPPASILYPDTPQTQGKMGKTVLKRVKTMGKWGKHMGKWEKPLPVCRARSSKQGGPGWPRGAAGAPHISPPESLRFPTPGTSRGAPGLAFRPGKFFFFPSFFVVVLALLNRALCPGGFRLPGSLELTFIWEENSQIRSFPPLIPCFPTPRKILNVGGITPLSPVKVCHLCCG